MDEVKKFRCPHCGKVGAGIDEESRCKAVVRVLGIDEMNSCPKIGEVALQRDDLDEDITEYESSEFTCHACGKHLAWDSGHLYNLIIPQVRCAYHRDSPGWDSCSEGFEGTCDHGMPSEDDEDEDVSDAADEEDE